MSYSNSGLYIISVAARLANVHPRTLRIYEAEGLISPTRTQGNIRLYCDKDIKKVTYIRYLTQEKGVNLAGVKIILELKERLGELEEF
ncbi:MerR family transcriptional regulator/heat shock protein HspR [Desulfitispora alkaliphila]|uniref:MerR family transcriptional regulator n=1 Tax=Desulfitispora alkaliphila TaxID=622674 RepID=UPI003D1D3EF9